MIHWRMKWQPTPGFLPAPWTVWKDKKIWHQKMSPPGQKVSNTLLGKSGGQFTNSSRKNEVAGPKWKLHSVVDMSGGKSVVQSWKEQYCIETWNVRFTNQGKLDMVKQEIARVNINILGISELKCMGMGEFNSDDLYFLFFMYFILFFNFKILYWFCHISTWIRHEYTCVSHPEPSSHVPPSTIPLGHPSAPVSILYHASNLDCRFISYMILYMFQCHSPKSSNPPALPQSPKDCSIHLCLFCCLAYRVIVTIFLNSIYMH